LSEHDERKLQKCPFSRRKLTVECSSSQILYTTIRWLRPIDDWTWSFYTQRNVAAAAAATDDGCWPQDWWHPRTPGANITDWHL